MKNLILFGLATILFLSCKKDIEELPEATQTGTNTFGAKIDSEFWIPQRLSSLGSSTILEARYSGTGGLLIQARNFKSSPNESEFEIYIHKITAPGSFSLNQPTEKFPLQTANYGYFIKRKFMPLNEWITDASHTGTVNITRYDTVNLVVSGTFDFVAKSIDSSAAPLQVTEGRFDIKISN